MVMVLVGRVFTPVWSFVFQLIIRAEDTSPASKSASTTVDIYIVRNMHSPRFLGDPYSGTDLNGAALGETIISVSALDDDTNNDWNKNVSSDSLRKHTGTH